MPTPAAVYCSAGSHGRPSRSGGSLEPAGWRAICCEVSEVILHAALACGGEHHHGPMWGVPLDHAKHSQLYVTEMYVLVVEVLLCLIHGLYCHLEEKGVVSVLVWIAQHHAVDGYGSVGLIEGKVFGV